MDRIKRGRRPFRAQMTKLVDKIETELSNEEPDRDQLRVDGELLEEVHQSLQDWDSKMRDKMLDDDVEEDIQDAEFEDIEMYERKYLKAKQGIEKGSGNSESPAASEFGSAASEVGKKKSFKLPKIQLKTFNGQIKEWLGFWSLFKQIHENEELHDADKFQYLVQAMEEGSRPRQLVCSYPQSSENYPKAIKALKDRYGKDELLIEVYVRELQRLVIRNVSQQKELVDLGSLYDQLESQLRALESLGVTSDKYEAMLYPMVESCLPVPVLRAWQRSPMMKSTQKLQKLMDFLGAEVEGEQRIALAREGFAEFATPKDRKLSDKAPNAKRTPKEDATPTAMGLHSGELDSSCGFCLKKHESENCFTAQSWSLEERKEKLKDNKRCFTCLRPGHTSKSKKCKISMKCIICGKRHFVIMCHEAKRNADANTDTNKSGVTTAGDGVSLSSHAQSCTQDVVLQTLLVKVVGAKRTKLVRALIDTGSQRSYITKNLVEDLEYVPIDQVTFSHALFGGATIADQHHNLYKVTLHSVVGNYRCNFHAFDQTRICVGVPRVRNSDFFNQLRTSGVHFSDVGADTPEIELMIGADIFGKLLTGQIKQLNAGLTAIETYLGWTLMGKVSGGNHFGYFKSMTTLSNVNFQPSITDLWELEKIGITDPAEKLSKQEMEEQTREHFLSTVRRLEDGRYEVSLPWLDGHPPLKSDRYVAEKRLGSMTKKLLERGKFGDYASIFNEWKVMGVIEMVPESEAEPQNVYYLPHRPVYKPESSTTKVRPVFDASCEGPSTTRSNVSLNQCLAKGPNLLEMIPDLLLRFREKPVAAIADIKKAFLMIGVKQEDRRFLRFLWWSDKTCQKIDIYQHRRVVFGVNSSPFLLGAVVEYHLRRVPEVLQSTARKLRESLYVDNVVASFNTEEEYREFKEESVTIMAEAKFDLRLWESNVDQHLEHGQAKTSVLGITWDRKSDSLQCGLDEEIFKEKSITKRNILSIVAKIFDPLGFLSPVTLVPKAYLQQTWTAKLKWDEVVPKEIETQFRLWLQELNSLFFLKIPRLVTMGKKNENWSLHTFCDASTYGYAAVIFLRCDRNGEVSVQMLISKSRVAPLKKTTINRLELVACEIGARLLSTVTAAMDLEEVSRFCWTDSSTALAWIKRTDDWGTFVGNRVKKILTTTREEEWFHVPGHMNPADLPSRGCHARALLESRWWEGPEWLKKPTCEWPKSSSFSNEEEVAREKKKNASMTMVAHVNELQWYHPARCALSKYTQLVRTMAYVLRFVQKARKESCEVGDLTVGETEDAERKLFFMIQRELFSSDSKFSLDVAKDEEGLLRVRTKITMRKDTDEFKTPVLLPSDHPVVDGLIMEEHKRSCHAGTQFLITKLRERVWILKARKSIDRVIHKCVKCRRFKGKHAEPVAAPLPENRVRDAYPFEVIGIDLAGPFFLKDGSKAWMVLYTCGVYRAIHLELVTSLSTEAFLLSFRRFISKNGRPRVIYTDNGTNFTASKRLFEKLDWATIVKNTTSREIKWILISPAAPWWGGWWERIIRTVKELLLRILGKSVLNYEELMTALCDVQAVVNGRPLTYVFENDEVMPLTPAMFLQGVREAGVPDLDALDKDAFQKRFRTRQKLMGELRSRFRTEYLGILVQRQGEANPAKIRVGDVVLIGSDNKKRISWPIGKVLEIIAGRDGVPRVAKIKTANGLLTRPFQRLYPMEVCEEEKSILEKSTAFKGQGENRTSSGRVTRLPDRLSY